MSSKTNNRTKRVDVVIVNYKTSDLTLQAVRSVLSEPELRQVLVVDNASGDDSVSTLLAACDGVPVTVIPSPQNLGFGGGNNLAARRSQAEYLFLLNSDAFIQPHCLGSLARVLEERPQIGVVAPQIYLRGGVTPQVDAYGIFPTPGSIIMRRTQKRVFTLAPDWLSGVAIMVRRQEFLELGGFDEAFFMYHEDVDLCRRYREHGLGMYRELSAGVVHLLGSSTKSLAARKKAYDDSYDHYLAVSGVSSFSRGAVRAIRSIYRWIKH